MTRDENGIYQAALRTLLLRKHIWVLLDDGTGLHNAHKEEESVQFEPWADMINLDTGDQYSTHLLSVEDGGHLIFLSAE